MTTTEGLTGRQALAQRLRLLYDELRRLQPRRTQKAAVEEANRRLREAAGLPRDEPSPRDKNGVDLSFQAVNDWFRSSKAPTLPQSFDDLWAVIAVMLEWTGELRDKLSKDRLYRAWHKLYQEAERGGDLDEKLRGYLEAACKSVDEHPYPGLPGQMERLSLAEVYVHQRSRPAAAGSTTSFAAGGAGPAEPALAVEVIFHKADRMCVLIAGPGVGKSTLLSTRLRDAARPWLSGRSSGKSGASVPIRVSAHTLAGDETQVPDALAASTRRLSRFGRDPELARARFLERPCTGAHWQLLVDDLDELPNADERRAVLQKLDNAVKQDPPIYRCVVATRPLTENELDVLGSAVPHYELQPFTTDDLHTYIERCFRRRWSRPEAARRSGHFASALYEASLVELARTPLMAFLLCQLYLAHPERPLPDGRTGVFEAFSRLLYGTNPRKRIRDSHREAIQHLIEDLQGFRAHQEAHDAARHVCEALPELIDSLAHQWLTGHQTSVAEALASHEAVRRPSKVHEKRWTAFLEDLLRHTGLLVHSADGLGFPHQTLLEYHAACHATRNEEVRAELLDALLPPQPSAHEDGWTAPDLEPSYLGFLLDALLAPHDQIAVKTLQRLDDLTAGGGIETLSFLLQQEWLRTALPSQSRVLWLTRMADETDSDDHVRVEAAWALARVPGFTQEGVDRLERFADTETLDSWHRVKAAGVLAGVAGFEQAGVRRLERFLNSTILDDIHRVTAAWALAGVERYEQAGVNHLTRMADEADSDDHVRVEAAWALARVPGFTQEGVDRLERFVGGSTGLDGVHRVRAAWALARVRGFEQAGVDQLKGLVHNATLDDSRRMDAAVFLASFDTNAGADAYTCLADDTTLHYIYRIAAAEALAGIEGYKQTGVARLERFARDPTLHHRYRMIVDSALLVSRR
ncbi:NACHT domain-containing protein [Actinacidiphila glaucinigra]|uniref:NACHT domain-containing protein n=1 Tax=Actinacidiphila glaucinigra TaxID=235986 RepID=A0A239NY88_9ACTN|nr:hypothetical protein [Actinacidiphila glaucinigra]SNT59847.1 hypothetical protein SAMN05216252_1583 [Actinacidiphila glaucinigra]